MPLNCFESILPISSCIRNMTLCLLLWSIKASAIMLPTTSIQVRLTHYQITRLSSVFIVLLGLTALVNAGVPVAARQAIDLDKRNIIGRDEDYEVKYSWQKRIEWGLRNHKRLWLSNYFKDGWLRLHAGCRRGMCMT
ncbi:uncharacterized protein F5147DRAFT_638009 [Suillus discolor]|uniref:Uncharacterized protein n=1 Tax=Suillus discolor TaxID=1912936 RepID=A0A9P7F5A2_9AGAM|nr:uncharacterized protein F5147DRAFT_638009 [Suillus discolor]KAG2105465.1 hypothetical protein F5147DRAFT_638009 [Suillus discolor]